LVICNLRRKWSKASWRHLILRHCDYRKSSILLLHLLHLLLLLEMLRSCLISLILGLIYLSDWNLLLIWIKHVCLSNFFRGTPLIKVIIRNFTINFIFLRFLVAAFTNSHGFSISKYSLCTAFNSYYYGTGN